MLSQMQGITYNKFETSNDWLKIDKTFDYKIENGKLLSGNEHIYLKGPLNYEINGDTSCIVDGVFTRTSNSPVLSFSIPSADRESFKTQDWEFGTYVDISSAINRDNNLTFIGGRYNYKIGANISGDIFLSAVNSTVQNLVTNHGDNPYSWATSTPFWFKAGKSGNVVYISCSRDKINWLTTKYYDISCTENARDTMYILQSQSLITDSWVGAKIDLKQTYIRLNNQLYFYNKLNTTNNIIPVPNNFTYGNTITDSIGYVDVRTQKFTSAPEGTIIIKDDEHYRQVQTYQDKGIADYTVVGNLTIMDGVASGFSNNNYLTIDNQLDTSKPFEMVSKIKTQVLGERQIFCGVPTTGNLRCLIFTDGRILVNIGTSTEDFNIGELISDFSVETDTNYWIKLTFTGTQYVGSYSTDGTNYTVFDTTDSTSLINNGNPINLRMGVGVTSQTTLTVFNGSIDLNETYIKVNGQYWFHPYPNSYPKLVGPVDYTVVGNLTIMDGVASGFSTNDYLKLSQLNFNNDFEIVLKFTTPSSFNGQPEILYGLNSGNEIYIKTNGKAEFGYSSDGNVWLTTNTQLQNNSIYYLKYIKNSTNISVYLSADGINYTLEATSADGKVPSGTYSLIFGKARTSYNVPFDGSIDLNNTYIKVNGALWFGKEDWTPCIYENNAIYLSVLEDSNTNYLGFNPTISNSGNYDVYIDNQKIFEEKSGQTSIDWNNLNLDTGYTNNNINYHTLKICPSIKTNNIISYKAARVQSSGYENQGIVRAIISCDNIDLSNAFETNNEVKNSNLKSIESYTSELMVIAIKEMTTINELEHIDCINNTSNTPISLSKAINSSDVKYINLKGNFTSEGYKFSNNTSLEKIDTKEYLKFNNNDFENNYSLKMLPNGVINNVDQNNLTNFITNTTNLYPTDLSINYSMISKLDVHGSNNYFITNLNSITVSNEAYFGGTAPQINVSYTGLDVNALVKLFNSLPTVTNGQTINIEGCSGTNNLTLEQIAIATNKGWNVYGYNNSQLNGFPYNLPVNL